MSESRRSLPSWMSSSEGKKDSSGEEKQLNKEYPMDDQGKLASTSSCASGDFSRLMEGIVFVLSGFVNPERGDLRSKMLEMGAEYQPDWDAKSTLLVCAFENTPKFRQVKADGGSIISKDWILKCYSQKKLVDIEQYLLHAGKPWRKQHLHHEPRDVKPSKNKLSEHGQGSPSKRIARPAKDKCTFVAISPRKAKKWAAEDLARTVSWLESQEEKPEQCHIMKIAAEGILTCIQDAIDALRAGKGIGGVTEQWACVPRVVEELARFDDGTDSKRKEALCRDAMGCKQIYELEFLNAEHHGDNSDSSTVEMTEEEIDLAYNSITSRSLA